MRSESSIRLRLSQHNKDLSRFKSLTDSYSKHLPTTMNVITVKSFLLTKLKMGSGQPTTAPQTAPAPTKKNTRTRVLLSVSDKKKLTKEYKDGVPVADLVAKYNVHPSTVYNITSDTRKTNKKATKSGSGFMFAKNVNKTTRRAIIAARKRGDSAAEIKDRMGLTYHVVRTILIEENLSSRNSSYKRVASRAAASVSTTPKAAKAGSVLVETSKKIKSGSVELYATYEGSALSGGKLTIGNNTPVILDTAKLQNLIDVLEVAAKG